MRTWNLTFWDTSLPLICCKKTFSFCCKLKSRNNCYFDNPNVETTCIIKLLLFSNVLGYDTVQQHLPALQSIWVNFASTESPKGRFCYFWMINSIAATVNLQFSINTGVKWGPGILQILLLNSYFPQNKITFSFSVLIFMEYSKAILFSSVV
jgi:hypothetical protein